MGGLGLAHTRMGACFASVLLGRYEYSGFEEGGFRRAEKVDTTLIIGAKSEQSNTLYNQGSPIHIVDSVLCIFHEG